MARMTEKLVVLRSQISGSSTNSNAPWVDIGCPGYVQLTPWQWVWYRPVIRVCVEDFIGGTVPSVIIPFLP